MKLNFKGGDLWAKYVNNEGFEMMIFAILMADLQAIEFCRAFCVDNFENMGYNELKKTFVKKERQAYFSPRCGRCSPRGLCIKMSFTYLKNPRFEHGSFWRAFLYLILSLIITKGCEYLYK